MEKCAAVVNALRILPSAWGNLGRGFHSGLGWATGQACIKGLCLIEGDAMQKYLVYTMSKSTEEVHKKYVLDESPKGLAIEEYIDTMGDVIWVVFTPGTSEELADKAFADYVRWYFEQ